MAMNVACIPGVPLYPINTRFSPGEGRIFLLVKLVAPGEPALFEDMIYESDAQAPPYVVELGELDVIVYTVRGLTIDLGDKVAGRMTTNLTNKNPDLSFEKHQGPRGSYYRIEYDIVFKFVNPDSWSVTSIFKGEVVGHCVVKFK